MNNLPNTLGWTSHLAEIWVYNLNNGLAINEVPTELLQDWLALCRSRAWETGFLRIL